MKQRRWMVVMACLVALTLALAGCGGGGGGDKKPAAAPAKTQNINIATATTGGVYYPLGNAMAQMFNQKIPGIKVSAHRLTMCDVHSYRRRRRNAFNPSLMTDCLTRPPPPPPAPPSLPALPALPQH